VKYLRLFLLLLLLLLLLLHNHNHHYLCLVHIILRCYEHVSCSEIWFFAFLHCLIFCFSFLPSFSFNFAPFKLSCVCIPKHCHVNFALNVFAMCAHLHNFKHIKLYLIVGSLKENRCHAHMVCKTGDHEPLLLSPSIQRWAEKRD